ncbi:methylated-DNA--[protein]-cysteine S-methyltransferase [Niabella terrae]
MEAQNEMNYRRIAEAIGYISENFRQQPSLDELAARLHLSPAHFQRLFTEWAGTSPKKFLQYISLSYAKSLLNRQQASLFDTAFETGLSSTSRLHELFIQIEGMTPAEYKHGGKNLQIRYSYKSSPFGPILIASTAKGICYLAFEAEGKAGFSQLRQRFPQADFQQQTDALQERALQIFRKEPESLDQIKLHLKGSPFQLKVWESLLQIPLGQVATYGRIASDMGQPGASRAVGTAIGSNPVGYLIPCHRVIQATGHIGGYRWGPTRKSAILGWEAAHSIGTSPLRSAVGS